jgi:hypothetical protein
MPPSRQAVAAAAADDVSLSGDQVADFEVVNVASDLNDRADKLVSHRHRIGMVFEPLIPVVNVNVRSTDSSSDLVSTSFILISGTGTSSSHRPGSGFDLTRLS